MVEIPIFEITFRRPLPTAFTARVLGLGARELDSALVDELADRPEHQVRVHRRRAVADQHRDALHAPGLARLDDEPGLEPRPGAHEMVVHRADCEEGRDRQRGRR